MLTQQLLNGVLSSGIYALYAVGFTMIFGIMGVLNMAHADFGTVAAFAVIWTVSAGLAPVEAVLAASVITLLVALLVERLAMRPGRRFKGDAARAGKVYAGTVPLTGEDIAETLLWMASRPPHVCLDEVIIKPTDQAAIHKVYRRTKG